MLVGVLFVLVGVLFVLVGVLQAQARHSTPLHSTPLHSTFLFEIGAGQTIQSGVSIHFLIENENGRPSKLGGARRANPPASIETYPKLILNLS